MTSTATVWGFALSLLLVTSPLALAADHVVELQGISFVPQLLNIEVGDKVTWKNMSALNHTATSGTPCTPNGLFHSGTLGPAAEYSFTFTEGGAVPYFCIPHCGLGMTGQITVMDPIPTENSTWGAIKDLYRVNN
jgi:plastocyanin